jgi:AcrR family transcriptional regulator
MTATAAILPPPRLDTPRRIIEAACALVVRDGYANLTLDAVAKEAAVSKGGLLYHFPSKRALLEGMVQHRCQQFEEHVHVHLKTETGPGRWLRAIIRASCEPKEIPLQEGAAVFAVLANDPDLVELVRQRRRRFEEQIEQDGLDPEQAALVCLAVDGLCFNELLGVGGPSRELRERVIARLLEMASVDPKRNET